MAKGMWVGVDGKARKVKKISIGVDGKAHKVKKVWMGVDGKARLVWQDFVMPTHTGAYVIYGDETKGRIELLTSGTLTLSDGVYDVFCVQGGAAGAVPRSTSTGAGGGGGGYTYTRKGLAIAPQNATVTIGAGGNPVANVLSGANLAYINEGGATSVVFVEGICTAYQKHLSSGGSTSAGIYGINGGSGGAGCTFSDDGWDTGAAGGSDGGGGQGNYSGHGQGTTTRAFGESTNTLYAGGGGGAGSFDPGGPGGAGGGGAGSDGGSDGLANTGGGGGGGNSNHKSSFGGGSGIVIVRWGY